MKGGRFEASNQPDFKQTDILCTIDTIPLYNNYASLNIKKSYRYFRYVSPKLSNGNIAELKFYEKNQSGNERELKGKYISGAPGFEKHGAKKAFDNKMLTYFETEDGPDAWVGLDLGKNNSAQISKIMFCPRNDKNCIVAGNEYELFYWGLHNEWISLGKKVATDDYLIYNKVPSNAIFWLKCHTEGKKEQLFMYKDGIQVF